MARSSPRLPRGRHASDQSVARGLRSRTEVDEKNGGHLWASPRSQGLLSYIFGYPENNRMGTSDSRGLKLCRIGKWSNGEISRMERWGDFFL